MLLEVEVGEPDDGYGCLEESFGLFGGTWGACVEPVLRERARLGGLEVERETAQLLELVWEGGPLETLSTRGGRGLLQGRYVLSWARQELHVACWPLLAGRHGGHQLLHGLLLQPLADLLLHRLRLFPCFTGGSEPQIHIQIGLWSLIGISSSPYWRRLEALGSSSLLY